MLLAAAARAHARAADRACRRAGAAGDGGALRGAVRAARRGRARRLSSRAAANSGRSTSKSTPAVLVPRPETELLVERALALVGAPPALVADLGTGSGIIAIALAHERPEWRIVASDVSAAALGRGAAQWRAPGAGSRRVAGPGDWFAPLAARALRCPRQQSALHRRRRPGARRRTGCATSRARR